MPADSENTLTAGDVEFRNLRERVEQLIRQVRPHRKSPEEIEILFEQMEALAKAHRTPGPTAPKFPQAPPEPTAPPYPITESFASLFKQIELTETKLAKLHASPAENPVAKAGNKSRATERNLNNLLAGLRKRLTSKKLNPILRQLPIDVRKEIEKYIADQKATLRWKKTVAHLKLEYRLALQQWELKLPHTTGGIQSRIVTRLRDELRRAQAGELLPSSVPIVKVTWRLLPPPIPGETGLSCMLADLARAFPQLRLDESRLRYAYELKPERIYCGAGEFDGYLAFQFAWTSHILLECPMEGNAAYIFRDEWRTLSRLSKTELLQHYRGNVSRVIHQFGSRWKQHIKMHLRSN